MRHYVILAHTFVESLCQPHAFTAGAMAPGWAYSISYRSTTYSPLTIRN
jgi:hypothetical protein